MKEMSSVEGSTQNEKKYLFKYLVHTFTCKLEMLSHNPANLYDNPMESCG